MKSHIFRSPSAGGNVSSYGPYIEEIRTKLNKAHHLCREHLQRASERQSGCYNQKTQIHKYTKGDLVWLMNENFAEGVCAKLQQNYIGPFVVKQCYSDLVFRIQLDASGASKVVNHNKMLPYCGENPPKWTKKIAKRI